MIKLRFVLGPDWASRAIALFSAGYFSHVDAVLPDGRLLGSRSDVVGGRPEGVQVRPFGYEAVKFAQMLSLPTTPTQESRFWDFLNQQLGKPYDKPAIFGFIFGRDWREPDSWFCSELMAAAFEASGIFPILYFPPNKVTPAALAEIMSARGASID